MARVSKRTTPRARPSPGSGPPDRQPCGQYASPPRTHRQARGQCVWFKPSPSDANPLVLGVGADLPRTRPLPELQYIGRDPAPSTPQPRSGAPRSRGSEHAIRSADPTDPSSMLAKPPRPRCPTTSTSTSPDISMSTRQQVRPRPQFPPAAPRCPRSALPQPSAGSVPRRRPRSPARTPTAAGCARGPSTQGSRWIRRAVGHPAGWPRPPRTSKRPRTGGTVHPDKDDVRETTSPTSAVGPTQRAAGTASVRPGPFRAHRRTTRRRQVLGPTSSAGGSSSRQEPLPRRGTPATSRMTRRAAEAPHGSGGREVAAHRGAVGHAGDDEDGQEERPRTPSPARPAPPRPSGGSSRTSEQHEPLGYDGGASGCPRPPPEPRMPRPILTAAALPGPGPPGGDVARLVRRKIQSAARSWTGRGSDFRPGARSPGPAHHARGGRG